MKTLLWVGLKFVAITGPVTWWWLYGGGQEAYWDLYLDLASPILKAMGVTTILKGLVKDRLLNFLPFVALMLITPGLSTARRFRGLAVGMVVIFAGQVLLAWWAYWTHVRSGDASVQSMSDFFPALILTDALPFVVWAVVANQVLLDLLTQILPASGMGAASLQQADESAVEASPSEPAPPDSGLE